MGLFDILAGPVKGLVGAVGGIIDDLHTSQEEKDEAKLKLAVLEAEYQVQLMQHEATIIAEAGETVRAEIGGDSWLQRSWRPLLMLVFTYIIAHNYVIVPVFGITAAEIPPDMWQLLKIGVGGYVGGRSVEKGLAIWKNGEKS